eukprot:Gregarina_sp_Pseudo_9__159@NODE_1105_length_1874_cov_11_330245_g1033_i0_p5_GENE_NODE_1105_length_1874_cov_11_330245_g1033_i0NODE_1105_length_1874_cov_11_330245_g1033_i0_p5_ORF_typecomplete_len135_score6_87DUF2637/PF10935_8/0_17_NODE_1105_length_1874_cov_11_330245_g1033_i0198602
MLRGAAPASKLIKLVFGRRLAMRRQLFPGLLVWTVACNTATVSAKIVKGRAVGAVPHVMPVCVWAGHGLAVREVLAATPRNFPPSPLPPVARSRKRMQQGRRRVVRNVHPSIFVFVAAIFGHYQENFGDVFSRC